MDMSKDYSVTVTVPIYNSAEYVDDCLRYLSEQTYDITEIIFVIDNRTVDDSDNKIRSSIVLSDKIRIIEQTDSDGLAGARNIGIKEARGDIIWFLDVDDIPDSNFLKELISILIETDADTVVCNHYQSFERKTRSIPDKEYICKIVEGKDAVEHYNEYPIYSWSRIQKKAVFNEDSMFRVHKAAEDIEQTIRQFAVSEKVCYYNKPLYTYVKRRTSYSMINRKDEIESLEETAISVLPFIKERLPKSYTVFQKQLLLNIIRQSTFSDYRSYSRGYCTSVSHSILNEMEKKTIEMRLYSASKTLYYFLLYPFSHFLWDRKKGTWGK